MINKNECKEEKKKRYKTKYSSGVIGFRYNDANEIEYLMVKRRFTYSFFDFLMGNYKLNDVSYIGKLITRMTKHEKFYLFTKTNFNDLWKLIWKNNSFFKTNYFCGLVKYTLLQRGYMKDGKLINLINLLNKHKTSFSNCEWGFPKGKKEVGEDDFIGAIREFEEETGVKNYSVMNMPHIYENHKGINGVVYKTFLYFVNIHDNNIIDIERCDKSEISDIKWFKKSDLVTNIRYYQNSISKTIEIAEGKIESQIQCKENIPNMINETLNEKKNLYSNLITHNLLNTDNVKNFHVQYIFEDYELSQKNISFLLSQDLNFVEDYISSMIVRFMNIKMKFKKRLRLDFDISVSEIKIDQDEELRKEDKPVLDYSGFRLLFHSDSELSSSESSRHDSKCMSIQDDYTYDNLRMMFEGDESDEELEEGELINQMDTTPEDYSGFRMLFCDDDD